MQVTACRCIFYTSYIMCPHAELHYIMLQALHYATFPLWYFNSCARVVGWVIMLIKIFCYSEFFDEAGYNTKCAWLNFHLISYNYYGLTYHWISCMHTIIDNFNGTPTFNYRQSDPVAIVTIFSKDECICNIKMK